jgi:hypothetical protein
MHMEETRKPVRKPRAAAAPKPAAPKPAAKPTAAPGKPAVRKQAVKARPPARGRSPVDREEMVRTAAYFRAQRRGFDPGYEVADWLAAELEIAALTEPAPAPATAPRKAAPRKKAAGT